MTVVLKNAHYQMCAPQISAEEFDGEYVVLDLGSFTYYSMAGASAVAWRGITSGITLETLYSWLPSDWRGAGLLEGFLEQLLVAGLIEKTIDAPKVDSAFIAEIAALLTQTELDFTFEAFDDLSDLLAADPIHDVEREAGWPHPKPTTK